MEELFLIIDKIGIIDADLKKLIKREIEIPYLDDYQNLLGYWYPHPPCFIPLFLGYGASYKDVAGALEELAIKTSDGLFNLVTKNWIDGWNRSNNQKGYY